MVRLLGFVNGISGTQITQNYTHLTSSEQAMQALKAVYRHQSFFTSKIRNHRNFECNRSWIALVVKNF